MLLAALGKSHYVPSTGLSFARVSLLGERYFAPALYDEYSDHGHFQGSKAQPGMVPCPRHAACSVASERLAMASQGPPALEGGANSPFTDHTPYATINPKIVCQVSSVRRLRKRGLGDLGMKRHCHIKHSISHTSTSQPGRGAISADGLRFVINASQINHYREVPAGRFCF